MSDDVEQRLKNLEEAVFGTGKTSSPQGVSSKKVIALSQLSRSGLLKNGQLKIAAIVGHSEMILNTTPISMSEIKRHWTQAKFVGKCDPKQLERAIVDGLIREPETNLYDLTQKGEDFFGELLKEGS